MRLRAAPLLAVTALALAVAAPASARSTRSFEYAFDQVWPATIRFLRVDEHLKIVEKDQDAGYLLFELSDGKRTFMGAAELLRQGDSSKRPSTRVTVRIENRPAYMEEGLLERLGDKLREELGQPPPPPPPEPPPGDDKRPETPPGPAPEHAAE